MSKDYYASIILLQLLIMIQSHPIFSTHQSPTLLQQLTASLSENTPDEWNTGIYCENNYHCEDSTICCSNSQCVHSQKCIEGQKLFSDTCDFNFECLTRCCNEGKCAHFIHCYDSCATNADCATTSGCCSEGYCTDEQICLSGVKSRWDYCDETSECINKLVCRDNICNDPEQGFHEADLVLIIGVILIGILVLFLIIYCVFKLLCKFTTSPSDLQRPPYQSRSQFDSGSPLIASNSSSTSSIQQQQPNRHQKRQIFHRLVRNGKVPLRFDEKYGVTTPITEQSDEQYESLTVRDLLNKSTISSGTEQYNRNQGGFTHHLQSNDGSARGASDGIPLHRLGIERHSSTSLVIQSPNSKSSQPQYSSPLTKQVMQRKTSMEASTIEGFQPIDQQLPRDSMKGRSLSPQQQQLRPNANAIPSFSLFHINPIPNLSESNSGHPVENAAQQHQETIMSSHSAEQREEEERRESA
ncbi:hypothetical protein FGO68_gene4624 [Halteria grandinella]|uniref:Uncharacterized protein n=1 Tax=Halteria grandinella TaxID=5974 RepID=A0A8J8T7X9_HALGN|nr:hypothetical protein FGO68_gene4624 [Halteria grandinella]